MFKDKVVVITGGANGIGKAIKEAFTKEHAKCYIIDIEEQGMKIVVEEQKKLGTTGLALRLALYNMSKPEIQKLYDIAKIMSPNAFKDGK